MALSVLLSHCEGGDTLPRLGTFYSRDVGRGGGGGGGVMGGTAGKGVHPLNRISLSKLKTCPRNRSHSSFIIVLGQQ